MPFHPAFAEQSAAILLFEIYFVGEKRTTRFNKTRIRRVIEHQWRVRRGPDQSQCEDFAKGVIRKNLTNDQAPFFVFVGVL